MRGIVFLLALCCLGLYLMTHPGILAIPETVALPGTAEQPPATTASPFLDEIHARYGNQYDGYEHLIRRTGSGGYDTREADAAMAGQGPAPVTGTLVPARSLPETSTFSPDTLTGVIESYIVRYTNDERAAQGMPALQADACLHEIARAHSMDMAANRYFSHENPRGEDPTERAAVHGCPTTKTMGGGWTMTGIGENIGKMPTGNVAGLGFVADTPEGVARAQVTSWMASPGHRGNILNPSYSHLGVGTAKDASGYYLSTQDFR